LALGKNQRLYLKTKGKKGQGVWLKWYSLASKCKALSSNPRTAKNKKKGCSRKHTGSDTIPGMQHFLGGDSKAGTLRWYIDYVLRDSHEKWHR
jgi:hypothetical protein